jgi:hypothetical protein
MIVMGRLLRPVLAAAVVCASALPTLAAEMTFRLVPYGNTATCGSGCSEVISAEGEITNDTPRKFLEFVAQNLDNSQMRSVVFLHSPGGGVAASMKLGELFRKTGVLAVVARVRPPATQGGATVAVPGARCFSACVYALMGARKRVVPPTSLVGIHRMFFYEYGRDPNTGENSTHRTFGTSAFVNQLAHYANAMGVSRDLIYSAEKIDPDNIHILTSAELRRWKLGSRKY